MSHRANLWVLPLVALTACVAESESEEDVASQEQGLYQPPPYAGRLFIGGGGTVKRWSPVTNQVTGSIPLYGDEIHLLRSPDGTRVFAANRAPQDGHAPVVASIAPSNLSYTTRNMGNIHPGPMAINPEGTSLYVGAVDTTVVTRMGANDLSSPVVEYAAASGGLAFAAPNGYTLGAKLFTAPGYGSTIYKKSFNWGSSSWSTQEVADPDPQQANGFFGMAWSPAARAVLLVNSQADLLHVLDDVTGAPLATVATDSLPMSVTVKPGSDIVYVTHLRGVVLRDTLVAYSISRVPGQPLVLEEIASVSDICNDPYHVAFSEMEERAFVICEDELVEIDTTTHTVAQRHPGLGGFDVVWVP